VIAAILIHLNGAPRAKQEQACFKYCIEHGYTATSLAFNAADAIRLVRSKIVDVVVAAYTTDGEADLEGVVSKAGGRLERVRKSRMVREVGKLVEKLFARRMSVGEISAILEMPTCDVRAELRKRNLN